MPRGAQSKNHRKISLSVLCPLSVRTFENLLKALQHLFVIFFDDMIEQKKVTQKGHVRLLSYGILWTVLEEKAYFMSESELVATPLERRHRIDLVVHLSTS